MTYNSIIGLESMDIKRRARGMSKAYALNSYRVKPEEICHFAKCKKEWLFECPECVKSFCKQHYDARNFYDRKKVRKLCDLCRVLDGAKMPEPEGWLKGIRVEND